MTALRVGSGFLRLRRSRVTYRAQCAAPDDMLAELCDDNRRVIGFMRETHSLCDEHGDVATASVLENWIDEAERRVWFLYETGRN
jgi:starvation-inducible DNA-binding protein